MNPNSDRKGIFNRKKKKPVEEELPFEVQDTDMTTTDFYDDDLVEDLKAVEAEEKAEVPEEKPAGEQNDKKKKDKKKKDKKKDKNIDKKKDKKKTWGIILGVVVAVVLVVGFILLFGGGSDSDRKVYVESVRVITGFGTSNGMNNRYTGVVEPQDSVKVKLDSGMSVEKCYVKKGQTVKKGDKLFRYNTTEIKLNKEKKELEIKSLKNESAQLEKDIKTYDASMKNASSSEKIELQTEKLTAQTTIKKNEYTIKADEAEIKTLEANLKDAVVKASMGGVIKSINKELGAGGDSSSDASDPGMDEAYNYTDPSNDESDAYIVIMAVGSYRVKGKISETNADSLLDGDPVIIRSRVTDETWAGSVEKIVTDQQATDDGSSEINDDYYGNAGESASSYNFYVKLDGDDGLMMGQHVLIEPDKGQDLKKEGLWLPSAYVRVDGNNYYVWVANLRNRLSLKKVEVGEYDEMLEEYEILSGLKIDDYIACDQVGLEEGMRITKNSEEESTDTYTDETGPIDDEGANDDAFIDDMEIEEDLEDNYDEEDFENDEEAGDGEVILDDEYEEDLIQ